MSVENACRNLAIDRKLDLVVFTGTHGVIQLKDVNGDMVDIYLYHRDKLPIPRYLIRVTISMI